jgi:uncharacterized protein with NRDE domain
VCLILVGWRAHPDYPLVLAANRDEFFARPTAGASFWSDRPELLAGRDLQAGGTWLGLSRSGRIAALTNYRDGRAQQAAKVSRGVLVAEFLRGGSPPSAFGDALKADGREFSGFNLLAGDGKELCCYSNVNGELHRLTPGIYGLSNHFLDTPWPKVTEGKSALASAIDALPEVTRIFSLLANDAVQPDRLLPNTGVSADWERLLSAAFVRGPGYGTRSSTVITVDRRGRATFTERIWNRGAELASEARFAFPLEPAASGDGAW